MIHQAPAAFRGSMLELYRDHIEPILPSLTAVGTFHHCMGRYCREEDPIFPIRRVIGTESGLVLKTNDGTKIALADNSPALVTHARLMQHPLGSYEEFYSLMRQIPVRMSDIKKIVSRTANDAGWYVAQILSSDNGDRNFAQWNRQEVQRRFYLTLHPCNLFFLPDTHNFKRADDPKAIAFMKGRYAECYGPIWDDFLRLIAPAPNPIQAAANTLTTAPVQYYRSRLTFKREIIEPLSDDEVFEVVTRFGKYRFRKRDFYATFPNIPLTYSYREIGEYHGAKLHLQAERFKVPD